MYTYRLELSKELKLCTCRLELSKELKLCTCRRVCVSEKLKRMDVYLYECNCLNCVVCQKKGLMLVEIRREILYTTICT